MNYSEAFLGWQNEAKGIEDEQFKKSEQFMIQKFEETYPGILFCDLEKQRKGVYTDDHSQHYRHKNTRQVYSWEYGSLYWYMPKSSLDRLFIN